MDLHMNMHKKYLHNWSFNSSFMPPDAIDFSSTQIMDFLRQEPSWVKLYIPKFGAHNVLPFMPPDAIDFSSTQIMDFLRQEPSWVKLYIPKFGAHNVQAFPSQPN